jgi:hypothetical protein
MTTRCPRCLASGAEEQHAAHADEGVVWRVLHCERCWFTWRSTEPQATLDPKQRPAVFQFDEASLAAVRDIYPRQ